MQTLVSICSALFRTLHFFVGETGDAGVIVGAAAGACGLQTIFSVLVIGICDETAA